VALEDLEDHRRPIEDIDTGCLLEVALLGRREIVIDEHHRGLRRPFGACDRIVAHLGSFVFGLVLWRMAWLAVRGDDSGASGPCGELSQLAFAEHHARREPSTLLRDPADRRQAQGFGEPLELGDR
jgi:hypothetical protein